VKEPAVPTAAHEAQELADFFDNAAIGLHWVAADGTILRANRAELEMLGYRADEYVGRNIAEFHADPEVIGDMLARLAAGETLRDHPARMRCRDGSIRHVLVTSNVRWREGEFLHTRCLTRDVTDRKRADALEAQTADYLEGLMEGFVAYDSDWVMTYMNAAAERLLGRRRADVLGKRWEEAFPHAVGNAVDCMYRRVKASGTAERMELFYEHYGKWMEISASRSSNGGIGVYFRDISDRKRAEQAVLESERLYRAIGESIDYGIWICDRDGRNIYASESFLRLVGLTQEECSEFGWGRVLHPDEAERTIAAWRECVRTGGTWDVEHRFLGVDGRWHPILARGVPVKDERGEILCWAGINLDIGRLKEVEQALREIDRRKDEFLATLSHELRNPLATISNGLHLLRLAAPGSTDAIEAREMMQRQVGHLVRLVDDLLEVSRITRGKVALRKAPVELAAVLRTALEASRPAIEAAGHDLEVHLPDEPLVLPADSVRLSQVIANLLSNAAKYTPDGGRIRVRVQREREEALISVRDNGTGIAPDMLPRVFEMFVQGESTLHRAQGGLGIGLTLARTLVELHGGRIAAASEGLGRGAEFSIWLPLA
jgi:PAS domain S-box-containing protein